MPFSLPLPRQLTKARWKVKIFDKENRETPHVTIIRGTEKWRLNLRTGELMDAAPPARAVNPLVLRAVYDSWALLREQWDRIHPSNPVEGVEDEDI